MVLTLAAIASAVALARQISSMPVDIAALGPAQVGDQLGDAMPDGATRTPQSSRAEAASQVRERPLFVRSRRPPQPRPAVEEPVVAEPTPVVEVAPPPEPAPPPDFLLVGVRIDTDGKRALVRIGPSGVSEWQREGDNLEGWKLETIQTSGVIMKRGSETLRLTLYRQGEPSQP